MSPVTAAPLDELLRRVAEAAIELAPALNDILREYPEDDRDAPMNVTVKWFTSLQLARELHAALSALARVQRESAPTEEPPAYPYGIRLPKVAEQPAADDAEIDPDAPLEGTNRDLIELVDLSYRQGVERGRDPTVDDVVKLIDESIASIRRGQRNGSLFDAKWIDGALYAFDGIRTRIKDRIRWAQKSAAEQPAESAPTSCRWARNAPSMCVEHAAPAHRLKPGICWAAGEAAAEARGRLAALEEATQITMDADCTCACQDEIRALIHKASSNV